MFMLAYLLSSTVKVFSNGKGTAADSALPRYGGPGNNDTLLNEELELDQLQTGRSQVLFPMISPG